MPIQSHRLCPNIRHVIRERNIVTLRRMLEERSIEKVVDLMMNLTTSEQVVVMRSLPLERSTATFQQLPSTVQSRLSAALAPEELASLLERDMTAGELK